jgi:hypothetical protein
MIFGSDNFVAIVRIAGYRIVLVVLAGIPPFY